MKPIKYYLIPALLVYTRSEARKKIAFVRALYQNAWLHIDVMDGKFVPQTCWCAPEDFASMRIKNPLEVHLMVIEPQKHISAWKKAGARRIVFHEEATDKHISVINAIHKLGMEAYIAINPETPVEKICLLASRIDGMLVMGVHPGLAGQKFISYVISKIRKIRKQYNTMPITVDGGVTLKNAKLLVKNGATGLVSTSAVYGNKIK